MDNFSFPFVVISQLPSSGSDIMETVFDNLTDYLYIPVGENELTIPVTGKYSNNFDFNHWEKVWTKSYNSLKLRLKTVCLF